MKVSNIMGPIPGLVPRGPTDGRQVGLYIFSGKHLRHDEGPLSCLKLDSPEFVSVAPQ